MKDDFINQVKPLFPKVDYCSFRFVNRYTNIISATRNVVEPIIMSEDDGLMVSIFHNGGYGYGATSDLTKKGISVKKSNTICAKCKKDLWKHTGWNPDGSPKHKPKKKKNKS